MIRASQPRRQRPHPDTARDRDPDSSLASLYAPLTMPPDRTRAHQALDGAVDRLHRKNPFKSDKTRLELVFERYRELADA